MKKLFLIPFLLVLMIGSNQAVIAQGTTIHGVEPKQGHASGNIKSSCTNILGKSYDRSLDVTITFGNVGALGGEQYKNLSMTLTGVGDELQCTQGVTGLTEIFDGGPNGNVGGSNENWDMHLLDGKYFELTWREYTAQIPVDDSSIFDGWTDEESTQTPPAAGPACTPNVRGLDPQKQGDLISPGATYFAPDGSEVGILQGRWFINGQETSSAAWDGKSATVELQWTCQDHTGYSQTFAIPAYQAVLPTSQPDNQPPTSPASPNSTGIFTVLGLLLIGLGGVTGLGGAIGVGLPIIKIITAGSGPAATVPSPVQAPIQVPAQPVTKPTLITNNSPTKTPGKPDPSLKKSWELKINDLVDQRTKIQMKIQSTNQAIDKLTRLFKNNILKVIMKGGLETGQIIFDAVSGGTSEIPYLAVEIGKKSLNDKIMEKIVQKHDSSQDDKNVVGLKDLIEKLKNQREQLRNQVKDINHELKGIRAHLQEDFQKGKKDCYEYSILPPD